MKKKIIVFIMGIFFIGAGMIPCINGTILEINNILNINNKVNVVYNFKEPYITKVNLSSIEFNRIIATSLDPAGKIGEPLVPSKGAYILLPPETDNIEISVNTKNMNKIHSDKYIEPMESPKTILELKNAQPPKPDEKIYNKNDFYPGKLYSEVGRYNFRGYQILVLLLHPIQYNPVTGTINYYEEMDVTIKTSSLKEISPLYRGLEIDKNEIQKKIDNPRDIILYEKFKTKTSDIKTGYDFLIITTEELKTFFQKFKEDHDFRGIYTEIKTLSDIGGSETPENIRDFIINEYNTNNIEYVLLGGDADIVPSRIMYVSGMDEDSTRIGTSMPCDLYYSCLDDNGPTNTGGDLIAEVYLGRACVDDSDDVNNFIEKTNTYLNFSRGYDNYLDEVLLAGEYKGDYGVASYGGDQMDQLIDECSDPDYTTIGFSSNSYNIEKLYDRDLSEAWGTQDIINEMNSGKHFIMHSGHAYYNHNMRITSNWITSGILNNSKVPFFAYSEGCMSGGFDDPKDYDCIAEYLTVKSESGAFAGIWNARWGFFWSFRLDGDSSRYYREFLDAVFGEKIYNIAKANQDSREDNLHLIERSCMRFVYYELTLFGDPTVSFHISYSPDKPNTPIGNIEGKLDEEYAYQTSTSDPDGDQVYYKWDWGDDTYSDWFGPFNSGEICEISHIWDDEGDYEIRVKAKDVNGEESEWSDPLTVTMPRNKIYNQIPNILLWLFERFPFLEQFFSHFI
ncbi:C25 family cysteine peptidase [Thermoplasmatota archaeon]